MTEQEARHCLAVHEAGHAAVALYLGMLGADGISIQDGGYGGWTDIDLGIEGLRQPERIRDRLTVTMAGPAADVHLRTNVATSQIDWTWALDKIKDWEQDIVTGSRWAWLGQNVDLAWERIIRPYLDSLAPQTKPKECEIQRLIADDPSFKGEWDLSKLQPYFDRARGLLQQPQLRCFVENASQQFQVTNKLSRQECGAIWNGCA